MIVMILLQLLVLTRSGSQWRSGTRETEVRLDGWCEINRFGGLRQHRNDSGGSPTMRERSERVESPGTNVTK